MLGILSSGNSKGSVSDTPSSWQLLPSGLRPSCPESLAAASSEGNVPEGSGELEPPRNSSPAGCCGVGLDVGSVVLIENEPSLLV